MVDQLSEILNAEEGAAKADADIGVRRICDEVSRSKGKSVHEDGPRRVLFDCLIHRRLACSQIKGTLGCAALGS